MPKGSLPSSIILLIVLIALNALFAMSEIAVISFNDNKLKKMAHGGNKKAQTLVKLTKQPSRFLATIQVGVTLSGLLSSAVAADTFASHIETLFVSLPISATLVRLLSLILITLILAYVNLVFGELVPKRIGLNNPEKISFGVSGILNVTSIIAKPFVFLLSASTNGILRLIGVDPDKAGEDVTEEEIRMMIDVGEEEGNIEQTEREMIHNIFEFDDRAAEDIMIHRTEIVALDVNADLQHIIDTAVNSGHSRIPVYKDGLDNIIGILYIKDLLQLVVAQPEQFDIANYMRRVMYVPESARCDDIFEQFRTSKVQLAVVVDEYGGTAGIVTMEDLLETIVGDIEDEYDDEDDDIVQLSETEFVLDGTAWIEDVADELGIPFKDDGDYDTIAGFITETLRHLPREGEEVSYGGYLFTVTKTQEHRVAVITAVKQQLQAPPES